MAKKKKTYPGWFDSFGGFWTNLHDYALSQGPYDDGSGRASVPKGYHLVYVDPWTMGIAPDAKKKKPKTDNSNYSEPTVNPKSNFIPSQPTTGGGSNHHLMGPAATSDPFHFLK
jgi:hypothetical protein